MAPFWESLLMRISWNGIFLWLKRNPLHPCWNGKKGAAAWGEFIHGDVGRFNGIFALEAPQRHSSKYPIASWYMALMLMTVMEFTWIFIQQSMAFCVSHNQILRHLCEKPGSMENKAFKSFIFYWGIWHPKNGQRRCQIPGEDLYFFFVKLNQAYDVSKVDSNLDENVGSTNFLLNSKVPTDFGAWRIIPWLVSG